MDMALEYAHLALLRLHSRLRFCHCVVEQGSKQNKNALIYSSMRVKSALLTVKNG